MRVPLKDLLKKLGVSRVLSAYETHPWFLYDEDKGMTCSAEVRMGPGLQDMEAELQLLHDEDSSDAEQADPQTSPRQIMLMRALPTADGNWAPKSLLVKGESLAETLGGWDEKGCNFFLACVQSIQMGELPDIDMLIDKELEDEGEGSGRSGRIGRKSPKINSAAVLGMKK